MHNVKKNKKFLCYIVAINTRQKMNLLKFTQKKKKKEFDDERVHCE